MHTNLPLIGESEIEQFKKSAPEYASALRSLLENEMLQPIVDALVIRGYAEDALSALERVLREEVGRGNEFEAGRIALKDLGNGATKTSAERRLEWMISRNQTNPGFELTHRILGSIGHRVVPEILGGRLPSANDVASLREPDSHLLNQLSLIQEHGSARSEQYSLCADGFSLRSSTDIFRSGQYRQSFIDELRSLLGAIWPSLPPEENGPTLPLFLYRHDPNMVVQLSEMLAPVVGAGCITRFLGGNVREQELFLLSLVNWATAVLEYNEHGPRILFSEVPTLSRSLGVGGGTIDALEVAEIDGGTISARAHVGLRKALEEHRAGLIKSSGQLVARVRQLTGGVPTLRVLDWKFGVGDAVTGEVLPASTRVKPPQKHVRQVERYVSLVAVDFAHVSGHDARRTFGSRLVQRDFPFVSHGGLVYFLNTPTPPVVHPVRLGLDRRSKLVRDTYGELTGAAERWRIRQIRNRLCVIGIKALDPKSDLG